MPKKIYSELNLKSRIHKLNNFQDDSCFVKRDDELSCGISGTKLRKYSSLIPYWLENNIEHLVIIATTQSNNLLAALQVAREYQLKISAFILKPWQTPDRGNYILSKMMLEETNCHWVEREQWPEVDSLANDYIATLAEKAFILSEGASVKQALSGAMTLGQDICRNEKENGITFNHLFIDAGTGFSAAGLLKSMFDVNHEAKIHILLLADNEILFREKLRQWTGITRKIGECFYPTTARSFGAINNQVRQEIKRTAREEGILLDPIYSAKLFLEVRKKIHQQQLKGNKLIIHSGGVMSLALSQSSLFSL
jgi:1-aminocyclopropane-1-carboxylate deaminase